MFQRRVCAYEIMKSTRDDCDFFILEDNKIFEVFINNVHRSIATEDGCIRSRLQDLFSTVVLFAALLFKLKVFQGKNK